MADSESKVLKRFTMGKGTYLSILYDETKPDDSIDRWAAEVLSEGGEDAEPFFVPLHWHKHHTERFTILEGHFEATINGKKRIVSAGEEIVIPPYTIHGFQGIKGVRVVARERADPGGDYKAAFFNDLLSDGYMKSIWSTFRAFYDGDAYPHLPLYFQIFDVVFINIFGGIAKLILPERKKLV